MLCPAVRAPADSGVEMTIGRADAWWRRRAREVARQVQGQKVQHPRVWLHARDGSCCLVVVCDAIKAYHVRVLAFGVLPGVGMESSWAYVFFAEFAFVCCVASFPVAEAIGSTCTTDQIVVLVFAFRGS